MKPERRGGRWVDVSSNPSDVMNLEYRIVGPGWAKCSVAHNGSRADFSVSHQADALGDLVRAAHRLHTSGDAIDFTWKVSGGDHRWSFEPKPPDDTRVLIEHITAWDNDVVFDELVPRELVVRSIAEAARIVLHEVGGDVEYKRRWNDYPFPMAELARIILR